MILCNSVCLVNKGILNNIVTFSNSFLFKAPIQVSHCLQFICLTIHTVYHMMLDMLQHLIITYLPNTYLHKTEETNLPGQFIIVFIKIRLQ